MWKIKKFSIKYCYNVRYEVGYIQRKSFPKTKKDEKNDIHLKEWDVSEESIPF